MNRDRAHYARETVQSRPVNLDQVAARLQDIPADRERSFRSPSPASTISPPTEEEQYRHDVQHETRFYNKLVKDGGRPSHPLSLFDNVIKDPGEYREILSFWQDGQSGKWKVFAIEHFRWSNFQWLQRYARGQRGYDHWRSMWVESRLAAKDDGDSDRTLDKWHSEEQWEHHWQDIVKNGLDNGVVCVGQNQLWAQFLERQGHIPEQQGFPEYVEAVKERLKRHGFTRPFQLDKDAARQDKLTTWIEYLGYEYWWYDQYALNTCQQKWYDDAWKKLVDSGVLRLEDTKEHICKTGITYRDTEEEKQAEKAMQSAMLNVASAETSISKSHRCRKPLQQLQERLTKAQSILNAAKARHELLKTRVDCIYKFLRRTENLRVAKHSAERHIILLRWMLQQVPLIELELSNVAENDSGRRDIQMRDADQRTGAVSAQQDKTRKRGRPIAIDDERSPKRLKYSSQSSSLSQRLTSDALIVTELAEEPKVSRTTLSLTNKSRKEATAKLDTSLGMTKVTPNQSFTVAKPLRRTSRKVGERTNIFKITKRMANTTRDNKASDQSSRNLKSLRRSDRIAEREQRLLSSLPRIQ